MAITYTTKILNNTLLITFRGEDKSIKKIKASTQLFITEVLQSGCRNVLIDERDLKYSINTSNIYQLTEYISENIPNITSIAVVTKPSQIDSLHFWETMVLNSGLNIKVCHSMEEAKKWLGFDKAINIDMKIDQDLLIIKAKGVESSLEDSEEYISTVTQTAIDTLCHKILCDERELLYDFEYEDSIEIANFIKEYAPKVSKIAIVSHTMYQQYIDGWTEHFKKNNFNLIFFTDYDKALEWLNQ